MFVKPFLLEVFLHEKPIDLILYIYIYLFLFIPQEV